MLHCHFSLSSVFNQEINYGLTKLTSLYSLSVSFQLSQYLKHSNLASSDGEGHCHALGVGAEAVTLSGCGEVEATQVCDVGVFVHHRPLDVAEL